MKMEYISSEKINTDIKINTAVKAEPMPVYIYGQFIEHLGTLHLWRDLGRND